ncbi:MAG: uracil phosphoribosyltransferase [Candidatus Diapherotrites archaeon]|nr:uracil phosphoribosyltransferase [Candidatus Diapherotrites archaeon]
MQSEWKNYNRERFLRALGRKGINVRIITHPLILEELTRLRKRTTKRFEFRQALRRMGELLSYELLREAKVEKIQIKTPLGKARGFKLKDSFVVVPVLRAGLPIAEGFNAMIKSVEIAFVSCWREKDLSVKVEYAKVPQIEGKHVIIIDPMLATGHSLCAVYEALKPYGKAKSWKILAVIASPAGLREISKTFPKGTDVFICALDDEVMEKDFIGPGLNASGYIVPGLGDAGDRAYGKPVKNLPWKLA